MVQAKTIFSPLIIFPPIDSIMRLMIVWRITGKIIRNAIIVQGRLLPVRSPWH